MRKSHVVSNLNSQIRIKEKCNKAGAHKYIKVVDIFQEIGLKTAFYYFIFEPK